MMTLASISDVQPSTATAPLSRCGWCGDDPLYQAYHDTEWGRPQFDPVKLFEKICLEGQQAGLSWITVLRKRAHYRKRFFDFDPVKVAALTDDDLAELVTDAGLIRHIGKLSAIRDNAKAYLALQAQGIDFSSWLWSFVEGKTIVNTWTSFREVPAKTAPSSAMSKALKKAGFRFVGETTCYAMMQSVGMVNDHELSCHVRNI
ncbi:DNA-3-methyladenine glycosylase I [Aquirhabdus parva]|nr:DNA-3-methyladenine glycosylase I [Aquirhabdus parva]